MKVTAPGFLSSLLFFLLTPVCSDWTCQGKSQPSWYLPAQRWNKKHMNNVWNMLKVDSKDTKTISILVYLLLTWKIILHLLFEYYFFFWLGIGNCHHSKIMLYIFLQRHIQNLVKYLRWSIFAKIISGFNLLTIFTKASF